MAKWSTVFRFTESVNNLNKKNDRKPALFIHAKTFKLHFTVSSKKSANSQVNPAFNFVGDRDYAIKIVVDTNIVTIYANGLEIAR